MKSETSIKFRKHHSVMGHRQLAAIMFTDIEGYSATMQDNEQVAIRLKDLHRQVLQDQHRHFNGRIIQYYGDGTLSIFQSAVEAVECALEMQVQFRSHDVPVRIALHIGDVIIDEDHIFGDGVNLTARIESSGVPGAVLLSDKINDELYNHPAFKTLSLGSYHFKNIKRTVEVFALDHPKLLKPEPGSLKGKLEKNKNNNKKEHAVSTAQADKSIAVLPFINLSNDPEQDYFSEGVGEEIMNSLSTLKDLKVVNRSTSAQFSSKHADLREVGQRLGVNTVLQGSIRKQGKHLRVSVQLVNVEDGFHMWSEKYDRNTDDIFAIQDEVALAITEKLRLTLQEEERQKLRTTQTHNSEAYELYLKGRFYTNKRGASIITGIHCFQLAIDLDPHFAVAHAGLADATLMAAFYGLLPPRQVARKAKEAAEKSISLDPMRCEAYCSLGYYYTCFEWNWQEGEKNFLTSLELNPKYIQAHYWYGLLMQAWVKGDFIGAITHGRLALELEPMNAHCLGMYGAILYSAGKFEEALEACKKGVSLDPEAFLAQIYLGLSYSALHQYEKSVQVFEELILSSNRFHFAQNVLIIAYCNAWKFNKAKVLLQDLKKRSEIEYIAPALSAFATAFMEDMDAAFAWLEKAMDERDPLLLSMRYEPWVPDALREDPRYQDVIRRINFPDKD